MESNSSYTFFVVVIIGLHWSSLLITALYTLPLTILITGLNYAYHCSCHCSELCLSQCSSLLITHHCSSPLLTMPLSGDFDAAGSVGPLQRLLGGLHGQHGRRCVSTVAQSLHITAHASIHTNTFIHTQSTHKHTHQHMHAHHTQHTHHTLTYPHTHLTYLYLYTT